MNIYDMSNRTKTYIAGDWEGDRDLIDSIKQWNHEHLLGLNFVDVHEFTTSYDNSLNCSIKHSLRQRMNISKTFVLIVGEKTKSLRSGACYTCSRYRNPWGTGYCSTSTSSIDNRSYVEYECDMAAKDYIEGKIKNIVVIYNGLTYVDRDLCPESIRYFGTHIPSDKYINGRLCWNRAEILNEICK